MADQIHEENEIEQASEVEPAEKFSIEELKQQIENLEQKVNQHWDQLLRAQAETNNIRKRAERDIENAHKYALEKFSADLLPVLDSLERALEIQVEGDALTAMREGIELTVKMLIDVLKKFSVEQVNPVNEVFSPELHQAMVMQEADVEPGTVIQVLQKGYTLSGRLIRPALVIVAKAKT